MLLGGTSVFHYVLLVLDPVGCASQDDVASVVLHRLASLDESSEDGSSSVIELELFIFLS